VYVDDPQATRGDALLKRPIARKLSRRHTPADGAGAGRTVGVVGDVDGAREGAFDVAAGVLEAADP
jgi:hypothetical protein